MEEGKRWSESNLEDEAPSLKRGRASAIQEAALILKGAGLTVNAVSYVADLLPADPCPIAHDLVRYLIVGAEAGVLCAMRATCKEWRDLIDGTHYADLCWAAYRHGIRHLLPSHMHSPLNVTLVPTRQRLGQFVPSLARAQRPLALSLYRKFGLVFDTHAGYVRNDVPLPFKCVLDALETLYTIDNQYGRLMHRTIHETWNHASAHQLLDFEVRLSVTVPDMFIPCAGAAGSGLTGNCKRMGLYYAHFHDCTVNGAMAMATSLVPRVADLRAKYYPDFVYPDEIVPASVMQTGDVESADVYRMLAYVAQRRWNPDACDLFNKHTHRPPMTCAEVHILCKTAFGTGKIASVGFKVCARRGSLCRNSGLPPMCYMFYYGKDGKSVVTGNDKMTDGEWCWRSRLGREGEIISSLDNVPKHQTGPIGFPREEDRPPLDLSFLEHRDKMCGSCVHCTSIKAFLSGVYWMFPSKRDMLMEMFASEPEWFNRLCSAVSYDSHITLNTFGERWVRSMSEMFGDTYDPRIPYNRIIRSDGTTNDSDPVVGEIDAGGNGNAAFVLRRALVHPLRHLIIEDGDIWNLVANRFAHIDHDDMGDETPREMPARAMPENLVNWSTFSANLWDFFLSAKDPTQGILNACKKPSFNLLIFIIQAATHKIKQIGEFFRSIMLKVHATLCSIQKEDLEGWCIDIAHCSCMAPIPNAVGLFLRDKDAFQSEPVAYNGQARRSHHTRHRAGEWMDALKISYPCNGTDFRRVTRYMESGVFPVGMRRHSPGRVVFFKLYRLQEELIKVLCRTYSMPDAILA